jgi:glucoamylase
MSRVEQDLQAGGSARAAGLALTMQRMAWGVGTVPEQVWEDPDVPASRYGANPRTASIGFLNGEAAIRDGSMVHPSSRAG